MRHPSPLHLIPLACMLASILSGCGDDRVAGASTETTNGLSGTVVDDQGRTIAGARVAIWDARGDVVLGRTTTGSAGKWTIPGGIHGVVGIEVFSRDSAQGAWLGGESIKHDSDRTFAMRILPVSSFVLVGQNLSRMAGTPWKTTNGIFHSIPPGGFTILSDTSSSALPLGSMRVDPAVSDTFRPVRDSGLLVEDFDDGDSTWIYGPVRDNSSNWFTQTSPYGAALLAPLANDSTATPGMRTEGAWNGRSLHLGYYSFDTASFVQAGFYFRGFLDLSSLRSIRIRARGDGILRLAIHGYSSTGGSRAVWQATPGTEWTEFVFRPGEELPEGPSDPPRVAFSSLAKHAHLLMIQAYGGSELWIDDIRFDGIEPETCLP